MGANHRGVADRRRLPDRAESHMMHGLAVGAKITHATTEARHQGCRYISGEAGWFHFADSEWMMAGRRSR